MRKSFKKILASAMALATLTMSVSAVNVTAATPVSRSDTAYGTLTGSITVTYSNNAPSVQFLTTTSSTAYRLDVTGHVDAYYDGDLLASNSATRFSSTSCPTTISWSFSTGLHASAFGAHQASTGSSAWAVYTSLINFTI